MQYLEGEDIATSKNFATKLVTTQSFAPNHPNGNGFGMLQLR